MNENSLLVRNLFELAHSSDEQTFLNAKEEFMRLDGEPSLTVEFYASSFVQVHLRRSLNHIAFNFYTTRDPRRIDFENYESKIVEFQNEGSATKRSIVLHENPGALGEYGCALESMEEFLDFAVYLQNLFDARVNSLNIKGDQAHHLARLSTIEKFRECGNVTISDGKFSNEEMRQVLKFQFLSVLNCIAEPDFELLEPISTGFFQTDYSHWFKGPMLMQLDCEMVLISCLQLQNAHINAFLHHWMNISDRKLRCMRLYKNCRESEGFTDYDNRLDIIKNWEEEKFDLLKITEGLSSFKEPNAEANLGNRLCFRRPTDKMLITVSVYYDQEWSSVCAINTTS